MSAGTYVEVHAVMKHKRGSAVAEIVDRFLEEAGISIESLTPDLAAIARDAYFKFGALNFGDTFAYALARERGVRLLFKGNDFASTDIDRCQPAGRRNVLASRKPGA